MGENTAEYRELFLEESSGHLQEWESALLGLEKSPDNRELIDTLFRAIHTLKGSAGFVGCAELQEMLHEIESALQKVRDGTQKIGPAALEKLFGGLDGARRLIDSFARSESAAVEDTTKPASLPQSAKKSSLYRVEVTVTSPSRERYMRSLLVQSRIEEVAKVVTLNPSLEELRLKEGEFRYEVVVDTPGSREDLMRVLNLDQIVVHRVEEIDAGRGASTSDWFGMKRSEEPVAAQGMAEGSVKAGASPSAPVPPSSGQSIKTENVIRVPATKLDALLNLVGELVVQNSAFISIAGEFKSLHGRSRLVSMLIERTEMLSRVARQLQDSVMKVRMLPIATVFNRFTRVVRDLARARGKEVVIDTFGEETEIDKKVIDRLGDPLVHLVRNAVDHGLETPEERRALGKDPMGHVKLGAYQEGDHICIEIGDDGRGLDREKILGKAVKKGLVGQAEAERLSVEETLKFVFLPGFSTAEKVTDVSGRGVGLDVVKRTVEEMDGTVSITTEKHKGSTVTITLPLTMAIIRVIMVKQGGGLFAIPLSTVNEVVKLGGDAYQDLCRETVIHLRDEIVPVVALGELLALEAQSQTSQGEGQRPIVIVSYAGRQVGIAVEELVGNTEIVIKSLARHYREINGFVGASILGSGKIALILDVKALMDIHAHRGASLSGGLSVAREVDAQIVEDIQNKPESGAADVGANSDMRPMEADLGAEQRELLEEIYAMCAIGASQSMSRLIGRDIQVSFPELSVTPLGAVASMLGGEEAAVARIYVGVRGDLTGGCLLVLSLEEALRFCDWLLGRQPGRTSEIGEEEISALSEQGNILCASFINAISDATALSVAADVPDLAVDMCEAAIDSVLARFTRPGNTILLTRTELLSEENEHTLCHFMLFLDGDSFNVLGEALRRKLVARKSAQS